MSSSSGVQVDQSCLQAFQNLKIAKTKYVLFKLTDDRKSIIVEKDSETGTYNEFLTALPNDDCRWAVFDFKFSVPEGERNKIVFYSWQPDSAYIKNKMLYSAATDALRRALNGFSKEIKGSDTDEFSYVTVKEHVK
ncbi:cofilin [Entomortierella lignicola]|nr:cofilin [Entomortierella lignicola]